jgi:hypothetical protein
VVAWVPTVDQVPFERRGLLGSTSIDQVLSPMGGVAQTCPLPTSHGLGRLVRPLNLVDHPADIIHGGSMVQRPTDIFLLGKQEATGEEPAKQVLHQSLGMATVRTHAECTRAHDLWPVADEEAYLISSNGTLTKKRNTWAICVVRMVPAASTSHPAVRSDELDRRSESQGEPIHAGLMSADSGSKFMLSKIPGIS